MSKILNIIILTLLLTAHLYGDKKLDILKLQHKNHIVKEYKTWLGWRDTTLLQRINKSPKNIINYITLDNKIFGYDDIPKQVDIDSGLNKDLIDAIKELPEVVKKQMQKHLIGIFILSGLGSTGYSEYIYNGENYDGGFILLDQDILLNITANKWATWRVNSAFKQNDLYELSLNIEDKSSDTRKQAIQFILLHEIAHLLGPALKAHPRTDEGDPKDFSFSAISWLSFKDSIYDKDFKQRKNIKFYSFKKAKLDIKNTSKILTNLNKSDFCSVYASTSFFEDFAEAYAIYVHTVLMKKAYSLKLLYKNKEIASFKNQYNMNKFKKKRKYFDKLFLK